MQGNKPRFSFMIVTVSLTHTSIFGPLHLVQDYLNEPVPEHTWILLKQVTVSGSGISWANLHLAPDRITMPAAHHSVFTVQMPFLSHNQQRQSTEGTVSLNFAEKNRKRRKGLLSSMLCKEDAVYPKKWIKLISFVV